VRLSRGRAALDAPWDLPTASISHVWSHPTVRNTWIRAAWPTDPTGRFVAPADLHVGHVLEVGHWFGDRWSATYGWVADARPDRFVLVPAASASDACATARLAVDACRAAELVDLEATWRRRIETATRFRRMPR
jgi:hypothetical protein